MEKRMPSSTARVLFAGALVLAAGCAHFRQDWRSAMNSHCPRDILHFKSIQRDPDRYRGSLQAFRGDIGDAWKAGGSLILQMFMQDSSSGFGTSPYDYILVVVPETFNVPIGAGDKGVHVLGRIADSLSGDESFGPKKDAFTLQMAAIKSEKGMWFEPSEREAQTAWRDCD